VSAPAAARPSADDLDRAAGPVGPFTGTGRLLRFLLRRDRRRAPGWVLGVSLLMTYFATVLQTVFTTDEELQGIAAFAESPMGKLLGGPGFGYADITLERFLVGQYGLYILLAAAVMSLLTVVRHTRAEERSGRAELVRANVVGRHALLTAALALTVAMDLAVVVLVALVMVGSGYGTAGSVLFAAGLGAVGVAFAGVAAVCAQVTAHPRAAAGTAGAVLGLAFLLRGLGDIAGAGGAHVLSWLSPIGWSQQTRAFVDDRWWPLLLSVAFAVVCASVAYALSDRRDLDAGLVATRRGSPRAAPWLSTPLTLAFRLHRPSLVGWTVGMALGGFAYGSFTQPLIDGFADAPEDLLAVMGGEEDLLTGYLGLMGFMMAVIVTIFAILAVRVVANEEAEGRTEPVLATAVSRTAWLGSHLAVSVGGALWLLVVAGLGNGLGAAASTGDVGLIGDVVLGHAAHAPAVWTVLALAVALHGAGRGFGLAWMLLGASFVVGVFGPILEIPARVVDLSVYEHIGQYPSEPVSSAAVGTLTLIAAFLAVAGVAGFRRRDVFTT
jgi:ABC-2 type transport system permease protein